MKKSDQTNIQHVIDKYKSNCQKLVPIYSPAIDEEVNFNMAGFKHLIFKNNHRRKNSVIYNRMVLVPLIKPVIRKSIEIKETRERVENVSGKDIEVVYKAIESRVGKSNTRVRVVIKKIGKNGKYYFQSIMKYN